MIRKNFNMKRIIQHKWSLIATLLVCSTLLLSFQLYSSSDSATEKKDSNGIQFIQQDWDKALQQAKEENKLIFIDIYATWCGPCKLLQKKTFTDKNVADFFNKNFINLSIDGEKTIGPALAQKFAIQGYPTLIVTDASGKPVLYTMGFVEPDNLLYFGQEALKRK